MNPDPIFSQLQSFFEGWGAETWRSLGAWPVDLPHAEGGRGWRFAVWAPSAQAVGVVGSWNDWQPQALQREGAVWWGVLAGPRTGQLYKYRVVDLHGFASERADPFARAAELRPGTASQLVEASQHAWGDGDWLTGRPHRQRRDQPLSIYELHLGSWRGGQGHAWNYRDLIEPLVGYLQRLGFTHVELLPVLEHPYDPSWGYQVTGYFCPTSRHGSPDDLRALIDALHQAGIGVIMDWVPAHFPKDAHALSNFDGTPLYEHADPRRGEHPDWGTLIFDYGRPEVRSFLLSSAHYWLSEFHIDGLRVDAVASMLYLDYSRGHGQWAPNVHGGNWNLEAVSFLRDMNTMIHKAFPGALSIAEESTAFPQVTSPQQEGGLGFDYKWNMGWMHDTLRYLAKDPLYRAHHHNWLTFASTYAFAEAFVLPLSHDEVVHGKGSLLNKMAGDRHHSLDQLRLLYGEQWLHPGKKLLFMGQEFGQAREWNQDRELDWPLSAEPARQGLIAWVGELNRLYRLYPALHDGDCSPHGFVWIEGADKDHSVLVWQRRSRDGHALVAVLHFTPVARPGHWIPLPQCGSWQLIASSDLQQFGGPRQSLQAPVEAEMRWGRPHAQVDVAPYGVHLLEWRGDGKTPN